MDSPEPSRRFRTFVTRRNALERRADRGMRAYVTGGGDPPVTTREPAPCVALRPHATSGGELKARGTRAARRPARSAHGTVAALSGTDSGDGGRRPRFSAGATVPKVATF